MKNFHKLNLFFIVIILLSFGVNFNVHAQELEIISQSELQVDQSIKREDVNFTLPTRVIVAPIYPQVDDLDLDFDELYKGIYYYTIEKLGYSDIPFHYIISEDGEIYEGNQGGDERNIRVNGIDEDVILVGYLTKEFKTTFSKKSTDELTDLLVKICNANAIKPENITMSGISFKKNEEVRSVSIETSSIVGTWNLDLNQIKNSVANRYNPQEKQYDIEIVEVKPAVDVVAPGSAVNVSVTLKNLSSSGIYGGTDSELIATKVEPGFSIFYINNVWLSQTEFPIMTLDQSLLPLAEGTFTFQVKAPLYVGEKSEEFVLKTLGGQTVSSRSFEVKLNMSSPERPIVEILDTETGQLNVRETSSGVSNITGQVSPGQRFFQTDDSGLGYIEIELDNGTKGWVSNRYVRYVE